MNNSPALSRAANRRNFRDLPTSLNGPPRPFSGFRPLFEIGRDTPQSFKLVAPRDDVVPAEDRLGTVTADGHGHVRMDTNPDHVPHA